MSISTFYRPIVRLCALASLFLACDTVPGSDDPRSLIDAEPVLDADLRRCIGSPNLCEHRSDCTPGCTASIGCFDENITLCGSQQTEAACVDANVACAWYGDRCYLNSGDCHEANSEETCSQKRAISGLPCSWGPLCVGIKSTCDNSAAESLCEETPGCDWAVP